ncbi:CBASS cGAMP-activated phospholipase [Bradyrhizobium sp. AUGA SZCCT0160]|uniref:CBASS cGAMP-activated phospholipase n=1 Tax=Bradyrhizobium sp. AUGA SZCCT0160 TaxID=2807662 RepID=UPI001BA68A4F|nr:CBASS cGAMP-activated phospholipase [Bradyrhizobium sp. AUGA SZCCT0160]MBR1191444.1 patatin-like phospholipase family protein [Bradyrhizobium sp. AUGA SZCCT0160]
MADSSAAPLKGARIWLSGSIPDGADPDSIRSFVARLSASIFRDGGSIIHGSHPTIWPILQQQAAEFQQAGGARDCLTMAISRHFSSEPDKYGVDMKAWRSCSLVYEVPAEGGDDKKAQNLERLRNWIAERCDAVVVVGGKGWDKNPGGAGIPAEFELARERGLPCFLAASMGGAAEGYLRDRPEILRNLRNGLDPDENLALATALKGDVLADRIVEQLRRLPLVRGEPRSGSTFRILSLDGGGIKGTFTAAVLAEWERITKCKLTDHFDLIAGTSTGGILALGLGMGLSAQTMLEFYEQRGPTVFPMTSLGQRLLATLRSLIKPKFAQEILQSELATAFDSAPWKILRDARCRLVIPSCHARTGGVHIFRTNHHPALTAAADYLATDIALATAAAPTYFRAAEVDDRAYLDGGVWANNPSMAALVEALSRLRVPLNHVDILSVGTTSAPFAGRSTLKAGFAGWLWKGRIAELLMHAQAQGVLELSNDLAGHARMLRVDLSLVPGEVSLDNVNRIADLKDYGKQVAAKPDTVADVKARFLNGVPVEDWTRF